MTYDLFLASLELKTIFLCLDSKKDCLSVNQIELIEKFLSSTSKLRQATKILLDNPIDDNIPYETQDKDIMRLIQMNVGWDIETIDVPDSVDNNITTYALDFLSEHFNEEAFKSSFIESSYKRFVIDLFSKDMSKNKELAKKRVKLLKVILADVQIKE